MMNTTEIRQELLNKIDHLSDQQLNQVLQFVDQVNQENNVDYSVINTHKTTTQEIMTLADIGGSFDFLNYEPDLYTLEDGEPVS